MNQEMPKCAGAMEHRDNREMEGAGTESKRESRIGKQEIWVVAPAVGQEEVFMAWAVAAWKDLLGYPQGALRTPGTVIRINTR